MFQTLMNKFEAKRAVLASETQQRIMKYAEQERLAALKSMEREQKQQSLLNEEVNKYLRTTHPSFLLKPEVYKALLNMMHARSEGTVSVNVNMTREMRKTYSYYHTEMKVFLNLIEKKGYILQGNEETFLTTFLAQLRDNNYQNSLELYGDFVPNNATLFEAFECYFEVVDTNSKYDSGNVDFFAVYLNLKGITENHWTKSRLKKKLKQYEKTNEDAVKLRRLEKRLDNIS